MKSGNLDWLMTWYYNQCDGDWEHGNGIEIGTLDNPGWFLKVSLSETELYNKDFDIIDINRTKDDWFYCAIKNEIFEGFGGHLTYLTYSKFLKIGLRSETYNLLPFNI